MLQNIYGQFFPEIYEVAQICDDDTEYIFELISKSASAICPSCGMESALHHDHQNRTVRDLPIFDKPVTLKIAQMKYYCGNKECKTDIFTEQNELVGQYFQFTERLRKYMLKISTLVSCEAAVKILAYQGIRVCGDTLLSILKEAGEERDAQEKIVKNIGVDDWAYRKGKKYGTLICDLDTHEIIDVLEGRDSETFEKWLKGHSGIEVVSRDRASSYSSAVDKVLPDAIQIADRFHITKNLLEALNDTMKAFMPEIVLLPNDECPEPEVVNENQPVKKNDRNLKRQTSQIKRRDKIIEIRSLKNEGYNYAQIAKQMGISYKTVTRALNINPDLMCVDGTQTRKSHKQLDPYRRHIEELIERGFQTSQILIKLREMFPELDVKRSTLSDFCVKIRTELFDYTQSSEDREANIGDDSILSPYIDKIGKMLAENQTLTVIFTTIKAEGYEGSYSLLQQYCQRIKPITYRTKKTDRKVKRRDLITAIWSDKTNLSDQEMDKIYDNYPVLGEIRNIISEFRVAYSNKDIDAVKAWCGKYALCQFPAICSFINGINDDTEAFYNSMKYKYNNGLLEGCVNKLKAIKRSMFGRASYLLLKAKLLLTNNYQVVSLY